MKSPGGNLLSLVIPTRNKPKYLALSLAGLARQSTPEFEIIIVNDGSIPIDREVNSARALNSNLNVQVVETPAKGNRGAARNYGLAQCQTDFCVFMDDDIVPCPDFVRGYLTLFDAGYDLIKGDPRGHVYSIAYEVDPSDRRYLLASGKSRLEGIALSEHIPEGTAFLTAADIVEGGDLFADLSHHPPNNWGTCSRILEAFPNLQGFKMPWLLSSSQNVGYRRELFERIGGFDEAMAMYGLEDLECGYRAQQSDARFVFSTMALGYHQYHSRDRYSEIVGTYRNWRYFTQKHDQWEVWLWLSWRMLNELDINEYHAMAVSAKDPAYPQRSRVLALLSDLESLTEMEFLSRMGHGPTRTGG